MPHPQHETQPARPGIDISHDGESDTLWVGNGGPVPNGMNLSPGCLVFFDSWCESANTFTFDDARDILLPVLQGQVTGEVRYEGPGTDAVLTYDRERDTLRLRNGRLDGERKEIFPGCSVFMEDERGLVSSLMLERAAALLLPVLTAESADADGS